MFDFNLIFFWTRFQFYLLMVRNIAYEKDVLTFHMQYFSPILLISKFCYFDSVHILGFIQLKQSNKYPRKLRELGIKSAVQNHKIITMHLAQNVIGWLITSLYIMKQIFTNIVTCKTSPYLPIDYQPTRYVSNFH